ncbi:MAG: DMT family transporter [Beijerinckiaceae bacterium]
MKRYGDDEGNLVGAGAPINQHAHERPLAGIAANGASFATASLGDTFAKLALAMLPAPQLIAMRSFLLLLLFAPVFIAMSRRGRPILATSYPWLHLARVTLHLMATLTGFLALRNLPLTTFTAIVFTAPLFISLGAIPLLGERIKPHQWGAIVLGFAGCFVIQKPGVEGDAVYMLLALASASTWALSVILLRRLTRTESHITLIAWGNIPHLFVAGAIAAFDWRPVEPTLLLFVVGLSLMQLVGQWFSMTALRLAPAATVAPVQYTQILWATLIGAYVFGEWPQPSVFAGAGLIIASGVWLMHGSRR